MIENIEIREDDKKIIVTILLEASVPSGKIPKFYVDTVKLEEILKERGLDKKHKFGECIKHGIAKNWREHTRLAEWHYEIKNLSVKKTKNLLDKGEKRVILVEEK